MRKLALLVLVSSPALARPMDAIELDRISAIVSQQDLDRRAASLDEQVQLRRRMMKKRVRALYKLADGGAFRLVADSSSIEQVEERVDATRRVLSRDLQELGSLDEEVDEVKRDRERHDREAARLSSVNDISAMPSGLETKRGHLPRPVPGSITIGFSHVKLDHGASQVVAPVTLELPRRSVEIVSVPNETVRAIAIGTVRFVGDIEGLGTAVVIDHGDHYVTVSGRLASTSVVVGDKVGPGSPIGKAAGATIAFSLSEGRTPLDPARWIEPPPIR